ncbi:MAG: ThiF family adenylyltransferase [Thermoplasmata archaeon]
MSPGPINRSPDLQQLRDEGFEVEIFKAYVLVGHVPYVNSNRQVAFGTLISPLTLAGDVASKPGDHVALWAGDYPCDSKGSQLTALVNNPNVHEEIRPGLVATHSFSQKPAGGYPDYYQKMTAYVRILEGEARLIEPDATARTFPVIRLSEEDSVFCYLDSASSRAGIVPITEKLERRRVAIVGLGGTGAYVLDFVAKTPVGEIHLFDGDSFLQHNAFRSPGAPSCDDLERKQTKVEWFAGIYSRMRRKIFAHPKNIDEATVGELKVMDFVFLCVDKGGPKRLMVDYLVDNGIPFVDVGMGLNVQDGALGGLVRVTTSTPTRHNHLAARIPYTDGEDNEYSRNIQIADMNALNAALAVIKWKKLWGFYLDMAGEQHTVFGISTNLLTNEELPNETNLNPT